MERRCEVCKNGFCVGAFPTNMRQVDVEDLGNGVLRFTYLWDSTTGNLADLGNCSVGEYVSYPGGNNPYCFPSPPWSTCVSNPTTSSHAGTEGGFIDTHSPGSFIKPYQPASFTAMQVYQYYCSCFMGDASDRNNWATLLYIGPIYRLVTGEGTLWRYSIYKSGAYAEILPIP